jgi:hypothetical protein
MEAARRPPPERAGGCRRSRNAVGRAAPPIGAAVSAPAIRCQVTDRGDPVAGAFGGTAPGLGTFCERDVGEPLQRCMSRCRHRSALISTDRLNASRSAEVTGEEQRLPSRVMENPATCGEPPVGRLAAPTRAGSPRRARWVRRGELATQRWESNTVDASSDESAFTCSSRRTGQTRPRVGDHPERDDVEHGGVCASASSRAVAASLGGVEVVLSRRASPDGMMPLSTGSPASRACRSLDVAEDQVAPERARSHGIVRERPTAAPRYRPMACRRPPRASAQLGIGPARGVLHRRPAVAEHSPWSAHARSSPPEVPLRPASPASSRHRAMVAVAVGHQLRRRRSTALRARGGTARGSRRRRCR